MVLMLDVWTPYFRAQVLYVACSQMSFPTIGLVPYLKTLTLDSSTFYYSDIKVSDALYIFISLKTLTSTYSFKIKKI